MANFFKYLRFSVPCGHIHVHLSVDDFYHFNFVSFDKFISKLYENCSCLQQVRPWSIFANVSNMLQLPLNWVPCNLCDNSHKFNCNIVWLSLYCHWAPIICNQFLCCFDEGEITIISIDKVSLSYDFHIEHTVSSLIVFFGQQFILRIIDCSKHFLSE